MSKRALRLPDIVEAIACNCDDIAISENDIYETIEILLRITQKPATVFRIGKMVNNAVEYEKAPV